MCIRDRVVRDYIAKPPSVAELRAALKVLGIGPRDLVRRKGTPFDELGLGDPSVTDEALIAAMARHPILIERPVVFSPKGARIVRPKEAVFEMLPTGAGA